MIAPESASCPTFQVDAFALSGQGWDPKQGIVMSALLFRTAADRASSAGRTACGGLGMTAIITATTPQRGANG
jgi:hypothetical protein